MMRLFYFFTAVFAGTFIVFTQDIGNPHITLAQAETSPTRKRAGKFKTKRIIDLPDREEIRKRKQRILKNARATTVYIRSAKDHDQFISGVIIAKQETTYAVLTLGAMLDSDTPYTVTAKNKFSFPINNIDKLPHTDLAIATFNSRKRLKVSTIGEYEKVKKNSVIYVSGYPFPGMNIKNPTLSITSGRVTSISPEVEQSESLIETSNTISKGMSGGPIYNHKGQLIAISGQMDSTGNSLGISSKQLKDFMNGAGKPKYSQFEYHFTKADGTK